MNRKRLIIFTASLGAFLALGRLFLHPALAVPQIASQIAQTTASPKVTPKASAKASSSPTSEPASAPAASASSPATTQKLRERIERIVEERRDQIQGVLDELREQRRGFIGEVQRVSSESITIKNTKGTQVIPVTPELVLMKVNKKIAVEEIAVGDWLVVIGSLREDGFLAQYILVSSTALRPPTPLITLGTIKTLKTTRPTSITVVSRLDGQEKTYVLNANTSYQDSEGNKVTIKDFSADMQTLVIGIPDPKVTDSTTYNATVVRSLVPLANQ